MMGVPIKGLICFCLEGQDATWAVHAQNDMTAILEKKKKRGPNFPFEANHGLFQTRGFNCSCLPMCAV